jgi:calcineurin-like phosphoesterase family protein
MSTVWLTSDSHFSHRMVAGLRGFGTPEQHDAAVVALWNATVRPGDQVWHLGDVGMGRTERYWDTLKQLNGTLHLVAGNHDEVWPGHRQAYRVQRRWLEVFETIQPFARRRIAGQNVMLSHLPYRGGGDHTQDERYSQYRLADEGLWLLCGHVHDMWAQRGRQINVGLDVRGLRPISLDEIATIIGVGS